MRVTVCELHDSSDAFSREWGRLAKHVRAQNSELVLLPETPFSPWLPHSADFRADQWRAAIRSHEQWETRLPELAPAAVLGTRPMDFGSERYNMGFVWTASDRTRSAHAKSRLTNSSSCWEDVWFHRSPAADFTPIKVRGVTVAFLIGEELSEAEEADRYGREGAQLLVSPRSAPVQNVDDWLSVGRDAARAARVYQLCSTRAGEGPGWVISPAGEVVAQTSATSPFVTVDIQLPPSVIRH